MTKSWWVVLELIVTGAPDQLQKMKVNEIAFIFCDTSVTNGAIQVKSY